MDQVGFSLHGLSNLHAASIFMVDGGSKFPQNTITYCHTARCLNPEDHSTICERLETFNPLNTELNPICQ